VLETDAPDIPPAFIGKTRNSPEHLRALPKPWLSWRYRLDQVVEATTANAGQS